MPHYPYTRLISVGDIVIAIQGPCIRVLRASGEELYSTVSDLLPAGSDHPISCAALDATRRKLVTASEDKLLKVWEVDGLKCLSSRSLPKKATDVCITSDGTILVADKFGDVFSYPMETRHIPPPPPKPQNSLEGRKSLVAHHNPSDGILLLGHASLLTAMAFTKDENYIITADRDEHIRVSHYPDGYNVERFCLGHTKYISAMHVPPSHPHLLVSGGGDRTLRVWDYLSGSQLAILDVWEAIQPSLKAQSRRRKFKRGENWAGKGWRARRRAEREWKEKEALQRKKGKEISSARAESPEASMPIDLAERKGAERSPIAQEDTPVLAIGVEESAKPAVEGVVVISRIVTLQENDGFTIIFSVLGADALFWTRFTGDELGRIQSYDTEKPVLDLILAQSSRQVWITLDAEFGEEEETSSPSAWVRQLSWDGTTMSDVFNSRLLDVLNRNTISATETDLENLDLYGDLTSLPKGEEDDSSEGGGGGNPEGLRDVSVPVGGEQGALDTPRKKAKNGPNNPNRAKRIGREVWKGMMEQRQNALTATIPTFTKAPEIGRDGENPEEEEPTAKRQRTVEPS